MSTRFIIVRHGQSLGNAQRVFLGHTNWDLSELGYTQAKCTARALSDRQIDAVSSSDLLRAYNTALPIAQALGLEVNPSEALREIFAGEWEGRPFEELKEVFVEDFFIWRNDICNSRCTGGESMREVSERFYAEVKRIAEENDGKTVVIASHAAAIRAFMARCSEKGISSMNDIPFVPNASFSVLCVDGDKFEFTEIGCDSHLADLKTVLPPNV